MGFQLVISAGRETGREFVFDQRSVLIGRTAECDIVLYDAGVSRKHARIFEEQQKLFIEDFGSANGTKINGMRVDRTELRTGDSIELGPVTFVFSLVSTDTVALQLPEEPPTDPAKSDHTRLLELSERPRSRNRGVASVPQNLAHGELEQLARRSTSVVPVLNRASDRSRLKRERPFAAPFILFWRDASPTARKGLLGLGLVWAVLFVVVVVQGLMVWRAPHAHPEEQKLLGPEPLTASFGHGASVTFEHESEVSFGFEPRAPVQVVVILHFQSRDISAGEVSLSVNGLELQALEADRLAPDEVEHEVVVPRTVTKTNALNTVSFDNVRNPPGHETWRIWNVWVEVVALPELDVDSLKRDAVEKFQKAEAKLAIQGVGASNLWDAYRGYREAWLALESLPVMQRDATHRMALSAMISARRQLDSLCKTLLLEARQHSELHQPDEARATLDHVLDFFPTRAGHPCQQQAEAARAEFDL